MSTASAYRQSDRKIGGAIYHKGIRGQGVVRNTVGDVVDSLGKLALSHLVKKIKGEGYKLSGQGKRKSRKPKKK